MTPEWLAALAQVLESLAWPVVAGLVIFRYRDHVGRLIDRLRKGAGAEFDPVPTQQIAATGVEEAAIASVTAAEVEYLRTESVVALERVINDVPAVANQTSPEARAAALVTVGARLLQLVHFERIEGIIWGSQVALLEYLNTQTNPVNPTVLKSIYYDEAARRFPQMYAGYSFEGYMNFLASNLLISQETEGYRITPFGYEYLQWRVAQRRSPRTVG